MYRGKEIFKPLNTGWVDEHVACVREWVANIFFYRKGETIIMVDAGYNYDRLEEKMGWLGIDRSPSAISSSPIRTPTMSRGGGGQPRPFPGREALYRRDREQISHRRGAPQGDLPLYKLPQVTINNEKVLLHDGESSRSTALRSNAFGPGHTWGHMVYLIDDRYLFTGDTIWFGADGGYSFISALAESNKLAVKSLAELEQKLRTRGLRPVILTGHTAGRTISTSPLRTAISSARHSRRKCTTRPRRTMPTTSRTTQMRMRSAAFCRRCRRSDAERREAGNPASLRGFGE